MVENRVDAIAAGLREHLRAAGNEEGGNAFALVQALAGEVAFQKGVTDACREHKAELLARAERAEAALREIGDKAHDCSTGPAAPDALWEIRGMAYEAARVATGESGEARCTCPSGDGSLRWPCPSHPPEDSSARGEPLFYYRANNAAFVKSGAEPPFDTITVKDYESWGKDCDAPGYLPAYAAPQAAALPDGGLESLADALELPFGYWINEHLPGIWGYGFTENGTAMASGASWNHPALAAIAAWERYADWLSADPSPEAKPAGGFYLASFKHSSRGGEILWWGPNNAGYTPDLEQAGVYTKITPGYHDSEHTVPVPASFIDGLRVRRVVDPGDSDNAMFWTAEKLRAAITAHAPEGSANG